MNLKELFLGIDTSCYTTSLVAAWGDNIISLKTPLEVKVGECGLRQSEAFFQHSRNLPKLFDELKEKLDFQAFEKMTVAVSSKPRNVEGSYMPVFEAGRGYAKVVAGVTGATLVETTHQDGHIMAALYSCDAYEIAEKPFLVYHISGGTTELLLVRKKGIGFDCEVVGGTLDLPAGQFVDRIGVAAGFEFPAGKFVDKHALEYSGEKPKVQISVRGEYINFSGEETRYRRILAENKDGGFAAYCTMKCISESIKKSIISAQKKYGTKNVLMVGGVSSSEFLRNEFSDMKNVLFAEPILCTDNAVGVCLIGKEYSRKG